MRADCFCRPNQLGKIKGRGTRRALTDCLHMEIERHVEFRHACHGFVKIRAVARFRACRPASSRDDYYFALLAAARMTLRQRARA
jgi:hypothetical protein